MTLPSRLRLYAQQFEDQHAPDPVTRALREAADEIERLTRTSEAARESRDSWIKFASISERKVVELAAENAKLREALEQINVGEGWAALIARTALTAQAQQSTKETKNG